MTFKELTDQKLFRYTSDLRLHTVLENVIQTSCEFLWSNTKYINKLFYKNGSDLGVKNIFESAAVKISRHRFLGVNL